MSDRLYLFEEAVQEMPHILVSTYQTYSMLMFVAYHYEYLDPLRIQGTLYTSNFEIAQLSLSEIYYYYCNPPLESLKFGLYE